MTVFLGIFIIAVGLFMLLKPDDFYEFTESWKTNIDAEPSDSYLKYTRIIGGVLLAVGVVGLVGFFFQH